MADTLDVQKRAIDVIAQGAQGRQLIEPLGEIEIVGIVDRQFAPESMAFFEVLLQMGPFARDSTNCRPYAPWAMTSIARS